MLEGLEWVRGGGGVISPQGMAHSRHPEALGNQYIIFDGYCSSNIYSDNAICRVDELSERGWFYGKLRVSLA